MFFAKNKTKEVTLVVDIGSSSVGAALVSVSKGSTPKILFSARLPVVLQSEQVHQHRTFAGIIRVLEQIMEKVAGERTAINKSHIIFSSPWHLSKTNILKIDHEKPITITRDVIGKLIDEAEKKFISESHTDNKIVGHKVIRTRLNGYDTSNPHGKKAKNLEITFHGSVVAKKALESICRVIEKHFHTQDQNASAFPLVVWSAISAIMPDKRDYLIVDVRGETTELSLVTEGALMESLSFPQGKNALIQSVSDNLGQSSAAGLSLLNIIVHGNSWPSARTDVARSVQTFRQKWLEEYKETIRNMYSKAIEPAVIFLVADPDVETFFESILSETKKGGSLHTLKHLNLKKFVETSSISEDLFLALESIFVTML